MAELRAAKESGALEPDVLLVFPGSPEWGKDFLGKFWPGARGIADDGSLYREFGLARAKFGQILGLSVLGRAFGALRRGHRLGKTGGDVHLLGGAFLIENLDVIWEHRAKDAGDHPDLAGIPPIGGTTVG